MGIDETTGAWGYPVLPTKVAVREGFLPRKQGELPLSVLEQAHLLGPRGLVTDSFGRGRGPGRGPGRGWRRGEREPLRSQGRDHAWLLPPGRCCLGFEVPTHMLIAAGSPLVRLLGSAWAEGCS